MSANSVLIGWDEVDNASSYRIEIKDKREWDAGHEVPPAILEEAWPNHRYQVKILHPGVQYRFRVHANNGCGTGPWSDDLILLACPSAPSRPEIRQSGTDLIVDWDD
jgi:hypothetical protein